MLDVSAEQWRALDVEAAARSGTRSIRLARPVDITPEHPDASLALIRLLRKSIAHGVPVDWRGELDDGVEGSLLVHLPPPQGGEGPSASVSRWRTDHRAGLCYYRVGPGFVSIKDLRGSEPARFTVDGDELVRAFLDFEDVFDVTTVAGAAAQLAGDLESERLILRMGDLATLLPYRMRRWPVPATAV